MPGTEWPGGHAQGGVSKKLLTGDEELWHAIAQRTGCSVSRAKAETTSTQFLRWRLIIDREWNQHTKLDHYMAQVCLLLHELRFILGGRSERKLEDFFMKFTEAGSKDPEAATIRAETEAVALKASILAGFGLGSNGLPLRSPGNKPPVMTTHPTLPGPPGGAVTCPAIKKRKG